jgi:hypothetical protein
MSQENDDRAEALQQSGVPAHVISYVLAQQPVPWFGIAYTTVFLAVMVGGFFVGSLFWAPLEDLTVRNALEHARAEGALLYHANFGLSLVLALFGWIFAVGFIGNLIFLRTARLRAAYLMFSVTHSRRAFERAMVASSLRQIGEVHDPEAFIATWIKLGNRWTMIAAVAGLALAGVALARDVQAHTLYTQSSYIRAPFFPWGRSEPRLWRDAVKIELGCNHVEGRNAYDKIIYSVHFADGAKVDVGNGWALPGGDWLQNAELIDAELRASEATFERWSWMNREPLHPACLAVMRGSFGADYPRIERLLRIGELPDAAD